MKKKIMTLAALWLAIAFVWIGGFAWQRRLGANEITVTEPVSRAAETTETAPTVYPIEASTERTPETEAKSAPDAQPAEYVVNTKTKKIHIPDCASVKDIKDENRGTTEDPESLLADGYTWCKRCHG